MLISFSIISFRKSKSQNIYSISVFLLLDNLTSQPSTTWIMPLILTLYYVWTVLRVSDLWYSNDQLGCSSICKKYHKCFPQSLRPQIWNHGRYPSNLHCWIHKNALLFLLISHRVPSLHFYTYLCSKLSTYILSQNVHANPGWYLPRTASIHFSWVIPTSGDSARMFRPTLYISIWFFAGSACSFRPCPPFSWTRKAIPRRPPAEIY